MKSKIPVAVIGLVMALMVSGTLQAQDRTEVTVTVTKDGKVVKDTTYLFNDEEQAEHALNLMKLLGNEGDEKIEYEYQMAFGDRDHTTKAVFVTKDGENTTIREIKSDSLIWITEAGKEGEGMKVLRKGVVLPDSLLGGHVIVTTTGDPDTRVMKVKVSEDGKGNWSVESEEMTDVEKEVYIISGDEVELDLENIEKEIKGDNVKVVVVKKKKDSDKEE